MTLALLAWGAAAGAYLTDQDDLAVVALLAGAGAFMPTLWVLLAGSARVRG